MCGGTIFRLPVESGTRCHPSELCDLNSTFCSLAQGVWILAGCLPNFARVSPDEGCVRTSVCRPMWWRREIRLYGTSKTLRTHTNKNDGQRMLQFSLVSGALWLRNSSCMLRFALPSEHGAAFNVIAKTCGLGELCKCALGTSGLCICETGLLGT